jgi:hypothetical protein
MVMKKIALITILLMFIGSISVVFAAADGKDLSITSYSVSPQPLTVGETVNVELKVKNVGTIDIVSPSQIEIQACKPSGSGCHIPKGETINALMAGQEKSYNFDYTLSGNDVVNGNTLIKFIVDGDNQISETDKTNNQYSMLIPVTEIGTDVKFSIGVNDYPDHQDYSLSKNLQNAYVNMYTVVLEGDAFKVIDVETKNTGFGSNPSAEFTIKSGKMVYFEGFKTSNGAQDGAEEKQTFLWTAPPYKNFGKGKVCQTHWTKTNEYLQYSEDSACATSLSTPYQDQSTTIPVVTIKNDLKAAGLEYDQTSFKGTVCNLGDEGMSGVKVRFVANGKENVLTYAPTIPANDCISLYSWGYSYFGISSEEKVSATIYVDPYNEISETNEGNNKFELVATEEVKEEMKYVVFTRSKDVTARGIVAKYLLEGNVWSLVNTEYAQLQESYIMTPEGGHYGESYYAEMTLQEGDKAIFVGFYPNSEIPETILDAKVPNEVFIKFHAKKDAGKLKACSLTEGCSKSYGNHAQELLYFDGNKFSTVYSDSELENKNLFTSGTKPMLPAYDESKWPVEEDETKPILPAYNEKNLKCTSGCSYDGKCVPIGTKVKPESKGIGLYCDWEGEMVSQNSVGQSCQNDYECSTNSCMSGSCVDLQKQLQEQQNTLEKILNWLGNLFG